MAYDEQLAERVRAVLALTPHVAERKMFGGIAFLVAGNMACGVLGEDLVVRLGDEGAAAALREPHTRAMDFTGRPMKSMVYVDGSALADDADLRSWVTRGVRWAETLPAK